MIVLLVGVAAVGVLLAMATIAQVLAGVVTQPRKGDVSMTKALRVINSSLMVTASSVFTSIAMAGSHPSTGRTRTGDRARCVPDGMVTRGA